MKIRIFCDVKVNFNNSEDILKKNVIYKLTFPSNKVYIGQTSQKLKDRLRQHCSDSFNLKRNCFKSHKSNAIRKYMEFQAEVLYQGDDLDIQEIKYIKEYNSLNREFGYNSESGGNLNKKLSEETKKKIGEKSKNRGNKPIIVTELSTGIETSFESVKSAAEYYKISPVSITQVLVGKSKSFKGRNYIARYDKR